jgi:8-oxo-dGTP diphosphatase
VVAALIADPLSPGRYLVQQRLPGASRALLWEFPGGKVEPGETDEEALIRECREELGVELAVGARLWACEHRYADLFLKLLLHAAQIRSGHPIALKANDLRYLYPEEMKRLPFCEADLPLLEALVCGEIAVR